MGRGEKVADQSDVDDGKEQCKGRQWADNSVGMCYMFTGAVSRFHGR